MPLYKHTRARANTTINTDTITNRPIHTPSLYLPLCRLQRGHLHVAAVARQRYASMRPLCRAILRLPSMCAGRRPVDVGQRRRHLPRVCCLGRKVMVVGAHTGVDSHVLEEGRLVLSQMRRQRRERRRFARGRRANDHVGRYVTVVGQRCGQMCATCLHGRAYACTHVHMNEHGTSTALI